jgi:Ca-activated chloride channel homolog
MIAPEPQFEPELDGRMRTVPLPEGLLARLRAVALADDADLDAAIRDVALPAGFARRLRLSLLAEDDALDAALRDVPLPAGFLRPVVRFARRQGRLRRVARWATAVSLLIAFGGPYVAAMILVVMSAIGPSRPAPPPLAWRGEWATAEDGTGPGGLLVMIADADGSEAAGRWAAETAARLPEPDLAAQFAATPGRGLRGPSWPATAGLPAHVDPMLEAAPYYWPEPVWGGSSGGIDDLPDLWKLVAPLPRGVEPPLRPGFDLDFYIRYRVHPLIVPARHPGLQTSEVPLDVTTDSYRLAQRYVAGGELPPPEAVRTEEFLAAVDYDFPRPSKEDLRLSTFCGPSPFGGEGWTLIQVGVQARDLPDPERPAAHVVLAIDTSASMEWGGRLEMIRRGLALFARRLGPNDRVSLVTFSHEATVLFEGADREEAEAMGAVGRHLTAGGSTNLAAGLRAAYTVAERVAGPPEMRRRVVLLSDGTAVLDIGTFDQIERRLAEAVSRGVRLEVIDLGQGIDRDPQLVLLSEVGGGASRRAADGDQVAWALLEAMTGRSQLVAADATLDVTFNPAVVAAYRLLGHEASAVLGLSGSHPSADFRAGQPATALYEVWVRPSGGQDVATVRLSWQPPDGTSRRQATRTVRKSDFTASFVQAPLPVQQAALVAQTAEILRRSPFARLPRGSAQSAGLAQVRQWAEQADTRLYHNPSFVEFIEFVEQAEKAAPYRRSGGR